LHVPQVVIEAHRSGTAAACASSGAVVTASLMGTIKLWSAEVLAAEAAGVGLALAHVRSRSISMASEAGWVAVLAWAHGMGACVLLWGHVCMKARQSSVHSCAAKAAVQCGMVRDVLHRGK
jgi:hypothetical protein